MTIWDLKTKKASLNLNNNRKSVGAIAWDPKNPTMLLTATPDDSMPVILLWNLRNTHAPMRTLQGHEQGVLSLSWCQQDSDLLLSSGKDNRTLCWNPQTGEMLGEFPDATNWTFQTRFNQHHPNLLATASFDGKIVVYTLQNANQPANQGAANGLADAEDFFSKAQIQPQESSFDLKKTPKWLERPAGVSFGFGGKLVVFGKQPSATGAHQSSKVQILQFSVDSEIDAATEAFEKTLKSGDISGICASHIANAKNDEETTDWEAIKALIAENPRESINKYLGFSDTEGAANEAKDLNVSDVGTSKEDEPSHDEPASDEVSATKGNRLSTAFGDSTDGDDFLSNLTPTKAAQTNDPFELLSESESSSDREITKALMLGRFDQAMLICLKEDRMADAFVIAKCGGEALLEKVQQAYLARASKGPNYLRLLAAVIGKNLWDIVYNADLTNWKGSMATLCTYADPKDFPDLCEALGDRISEAGSRKDAAFCYMAGSKLEKVVNIWISELQEQEQAGLQSPDGNSTFSVHARLLQNFIEKVTIFRSVTRFEDSEKALAGGWKLAPLYERYIEYADILASHGHLDTADRYLDPLPAQYPAADVVRNRVKQASRTGTSIPARQEQPATARTVPTAQPANTVQAQRMPPTQPSVAANTYAPANAFNAYAPPQTLASQQSYVPRGQPQASYGPPPIPTVAGLPQGNAYGIAPPKNPTPSQPPPSKKDMANWNDTPMLSKPPASSRAGMSPAPVTSSFPNQPNAAIPPPATSFGAPPRGTPTPPAPPPKASEMPRTMSPLGNAPAPFAQPARPGSTSYVPSNLSSRPHSPATIARGPSPYNPPPPSQPSTNRYAPIPVAQQVPQQMPVQMTPPPPQGVIPPPPANPYAPAQGGMPPPPPANPYAPPQGGMPPPPPVNSYAPPPSAMQPPPPVNPYAPSQGGMQSSPLTNPYAPPQSPQAQFGQYPLQHPEQPRQAPSVPPRGTPSSSRPGTSQGQGPRSSVSTPKYPPGDRSHIPEDAREMVDTFNNDMQRVAGKAPANFAVQVKDTQKRLNILFDHLNNGDLLKPDTISNLTELARALQAKNYDLASRMQVNIQREKLDECGQWMVSCPHNKST